MSKDLIKKSDYTCWFKILPNMSIYSSFDNCTYLNNNDLLQRADKRIVDEFNQFTLHRPEASILRLHEWNISSPVILDVYFELLLGSLLSSSYHTFSGDFSVWKNDDSDILPFMRFKEWVHTTNIGETPFSSTYYNYEHGLITYSVIVAQNALRLCQLDMFLDVDVGKALFCALTHRLDKVGRYVYSFNEHKNVNAIRLSDNVLVPFGRGMSSVVLLSKFFPLTTEEEMAIRWSGGAWYEDQTNYNDLSIASKNKLVKLIQLAVSLAFS